MRGLSLAVSCGKTTTMPTPAPVRQDAFADHHARNAAVDALMSDDPATLRKALADLVDAYDGIVLVTTIMRDGLAARDGEGDR